MTRPAATEPSLKRSLESVVTCTNLLPNKLQSAPMVTAKKRRGRLRRHVRDGAERAQGVTHQSSWSTPAQLHEAPRRPACKREAPRGCACQSRPEADLRDSRLPPPRRLPRNSARGSIWGVDPASTRRPWVDLGLTRGARRRTGPRNEPAAGSSHPTSPAARRNVRSARSMRRAVSGDCFGPPVGERKARATRTWWR